VLGLTSHVLQAVGGVLLEDAADLYERAVKRAVLNYRRYASSTAAEPGRVHTAFHWLLSTGTRTHMHG
jgi:hypothetical protein